MEDRTQATREGSSAVQGCLIAAVVLFILLLGVSIVLGYRQFKENTAPAAETTVLRAAPDGDTAIQGGTLSHLTFLSNAA